MMHLAAILGIFRRYSTQCCFVTSTSELPVPPCMSHSMPSCQAQHLLAPNLYLHSMRYPAPGLSYDLLGFTWGGCICREFWPWIRQAAERRQQVLQMRPLPMHWVSAGTDQAWRGNPAEGSKMTRIHVLVHLRFEELIWAQKWEGRKVLLVYTPRPQLRLD